MEQEFKQLDTTVIQVRSVLNFMYALGYTLDATVNSGRFVTEVKSAQGNRYISANTAVRLHNSRSSDWEVFEDSGIVFPKTVKFQNGLTVLGVHLAVASKLVDQAKFRVVQNGMIIPQSVMVKPLNSVVLQLVEPEEPKQ